MTIAELIARIALYPQDTEVRVIDDSFFGDTIVANDIEYDATNGTITIRGY